ncbi:MAG: hypothetical protein ACF8Q5_12325 [Phycisphaerales bacterium JB040]
MQRMNTTLARSLRALTIALALGTGSTALADGPGRHGHHAGHHQDRFDCGVCQVHTHHVHDEGGTLYLGRDRFYLWDGPGALVKFERSLERAGYRVYRHENTFTIRSHHRLGRAWFRDGTFNGVIVGRDACSVTIRFHQKYRRPVIGHAKDFGRHHDRGRDCDRGRWVQREHVRTVVVQRPAIEWCLRW